jgi:gliding motility-associated-like protein
MLTDLVNVGNPSATMLWSTGETSSSIMVNTHGVYYLKVRLDGCEGTDSVVISNGCYIEIPNAFTPNNDGYNDYFMPRPLQSKGLVTFKMDLFNRWGQVVFTTSKCEGNGWDGMYNGQMQPVGVYIYVIDATFIDGRKEKMHGNFTLIR